MPHELPPSLSAYRVPKEHRLRLLAYELVFMGLLGAGLAFGGWQMFGYVLASVLIINLFLLVLFASPTRKALAAELEVTRFYPRWYLWFFAVIGSLFCGYLLWLLVRAGLG